MKRLLFRLSALALVIVLGFIAIAQAQRGVQVSSPSAASSAADNVAASPGTTDPRGANPAGSAGAPATLPPNPRANPLRTSSRVPAGPVRATAVTAEDQPAENSAAKGSASASAPTEPKPLDPFGLRTTPRASNPIREAAPVDSGDPGDPSDKMPTLAEPRESAAKRLSTAGDPQVGADTGSAAKLEPPGRARPIALPMESPLEPKAAGTAGGVRSRGETDRGQPAGEPALLKHNPTATTGNLPRALTGPQNVLPPSSASPELSDPARPDPSRGGEGAGKPGSRQLEGPQTPQLAIQKLAPPEVQVGKPAAFQVKLRNTGPVPAHNVEIRDEIPKGARLIATTPRASRGVRGELVWALGTVKPGDEVTVEVQWMPVDEGEIGSVATVNFNADASARTVATKPQLIIKTLGANKVLIGEEVALSITVANPGSGIAQKVILEERVPPGLQHPAGPDLEYEIGDLKPNESRQLELKLTAAQAGRLTNVLVARGDANLRVEDRFDVEVLAPRLDVLLEGPKRRYLEREATYTFSVSNPGTAPARQVQLVAHLPPGLKFVSANNAGHYEEATRTVHWLLEELPVKETGSVELTTMPVEAGSQMLRLRGTADKGLSVEKEQPVVVEGIAAILFEIADTSDPIEVNGETTYEVRVVNQGSKAATNVQLTVQLPPEMRAVAAEGPTRQLAEGNRIAFEPLPRLAPKSNTTYRIRVQGLKPGDLRIRAQLLTDEIRMPVTKEESTRVYADE